MCNRINSQTMSLVGFGAIFVTVGSLIYLIHITHNALVQTRDRLRFSDEKLEVTNKQLESITSYTSRLEEAFINMKSEKASVIQNDHTARLELDQERNMCAKKLGHLQSELKACQGQLLSRGIEGKGEVDLSPPKTLPIEFPDSEPSSRHIRNYQFYPYDDLIELKKKLGKEKPETGGSIVHAVTSSSKQQHSVSGDPNEDLAGNVLI